MLIGIDGNEANISQRVGSNVYAFELIKAIEAMDKDNEYIIYLREKKQPDLPKTRKKFAYRVISPKKLWTQWRLPLDLYLHKPQPKVFFTPGHYAPRFSNIASVISILDLSFLKYPQSFKSPVLRQLQSWTRRSAENASHIFTISNFSKQDIIEFYNIPAKKITVTYPGINKRFNEKVGQRLLTRVLSKYQLKNKYLLFLGTKQPKKNINRLIRAYAAISGDMKKTPDLVIAGKVWGQFAKESKSENLPNGVREIGFVEDNDLPALMSGAQAFFLPSLYEGFGIPVVEAMAAGTPVLTSNVSSLPEITSDAAILVSPENTNSLARGLKQILSLSREKRVQLVKKGKNRARQFTWEKCAKKTLEVLYEIAN